MSFSFPIGQLQISLPISDWWTQIGREQMDAGLVGLCITYALSLTRFLNFLIRQLAQVEANIVSVERVETYLNVGTLILHTL